MLGGLAVSALVASSGPEQLDDLFDDRGWLAIGFATAYGLVWVSFSLWCLAWFRRRWCGELRWVRPAGRASYATYLLHPLVLTSVMMGLSWLSMPPEAKFVLVTVLAVPLSFAVGHLLTTMPGLRRVL